MKTGKITSKRAAPLAALLLGATVLLTGCGGSSKSASDYAVTETTAASYEYASAQAAAAEGGGIAETVQNLSLDSSSSGIAPQQVTGRKLIRNVNLSVETDSFDNLLTDLQNQITALSGYVERSDISGSSMTWGNRPSSRYASMTARIPSNKLDQFVKTVQDYSNVTYKSENTTDVTLQYSDLESRKKSLTMEQERIWALLEKADTLEAVISLEERLSEIRYQLESMESQLRLYDNQVDYSTVEISIQEVTAFSPTEPESVGTRIRNGFSKNLKAMGSFLTELVILIIAAIPIWLPVLAIAALIAAVLRWRMKKSGSSQKPDDISKSGDFQKPDNTPKSGSFPAGRGFNFRSDSQKNGPKEKESK